MASFPLTPRPPDIEIIVPAHNEADRLPEGLCTLCAKAATLPLLAAIVVVDSASTDSTAQIVRNWPAGPVPVSLMRCDRPGKGLAVQAGLLATQAPLVGFCDADMATDLSALDTAIPLLAAGHQVVIGSRGLRESVVQSRSSLARRAGAFVFRAVAASIIPGSTDTQCGFKFFSGPLARMAAESLRTGGFAFDVELLAACLRLGATVTEIPVQWRDVTGSTFSVSRHSAAVFRDLWSIWLQSQAQGEAPMAEAPTPAYAGWAMPVAPPAQLTSDGAAS
ncbi:MAG TPA: glycosyltransferase [Trebonia sp.]|nr:glycosyltransferase [Trebonia sp.]